MLRVNEIFASIQGEGMWTGTPMVFVRLSGCNLTCDFCDTAHQKWDVFTEEQVLEKIQSFPKQRVCLTGGEPLLQNVETLVKMLRERDYDVHVETNGTQVIQRGFSWITVSPKRKKVYLKTVPEAPLWNGELKIPFSVTTKEEECLFYKGLYKTTNLYVQPVFCLDEKKSADNLKATVEFVKKNTDWKLSLQTQRYGGFR